MRNVAERFVVYCENFRDFIDIIEQYGDQPALTWYTLKGEKKTRTYAGFVSDVRTLSSCFVRRGLAGKHIAVVGENSYAWLLVYFASTVCGSAAVCIDPEQAEGRIRSMVEWADAEVVFTSASCREIFRDDDRQKVFRLDEADSGWITVRELMDEERARTDGPVTEEIMPDVDCTASIVYTSGTTDLSRPVMLSQRALLINSAESNMVVDMGEQCFTALPFCHAYGMTCAVIATLLRGAELIFNGNMRTAMRDMVISGATATLTVPLVVELLCRQIWNLAEQHGKTRELRKVFRHLELTQRFGLWNMPDNMKKLRQQLFGSVRLIICGGAHLDWSVAGKLKLLGIEVLEGYGITECSPLVSVNRYGEARPNTVGKPLESCKVQIMDGEICVSGPSVMKGYYKMPEETKKAFEGGWFHTGDIGEFDKDGYLKITGRKKNLIVFKNGKKVSPEAYENKLKTIPIIKEVLVYGASKGDSQDNVRIAASVYPDPDVVKDMTAYEILEAVQAEVDRLNNTLPFYQQIQMVDIRTQEFERNTLSKIKRQM